MNNTIDEIIETAFSKLRTMADADTIVGKPITSDNGSILIPVSKVNMGFVAGGGEYSEVTLAGKKKSDKDYPFAGGSGAGMSITPIAFVSVSSDETKVFALDSKTPLEKILEMTPAVIKTGFEKLGIVPDKGSETATVVEPMENDEKA